MKATRGLEWCLGGAQYLGKSKARIEYWNVNGILIFINGYNGLSQLLGVLVDTLVDSRYPNTLSGRHVLMGILLQHRPAIVVVSITCGKKAYKYALYCTTRRNP